MEIYFIVAAAVLLLLLCVTVYVAWLLFSLACAKKIPRAVAPLMSGLIDGYTLDDIEMVKEGKAFYASEPRESWYTTSHDGLKLHAEFIPCDDARATVMLFHGYRSSAIHDFSGVLTYYRSLGLNILLVDQRSHGQSEGKYISFGVLERYDVLGWINEHNRRFGEDVPIILDGISMGGATVAYAAGLELPSNVKGIIDDCGFSYPKAQIQYVMSLMKIPVFPFYHIANTVCRVMARFSFSDVDARATLKKTGIPCMFIHGEDDDFVLCEMGKECYEACASKKSIFICPGAGHGMSYVVENEKCKVLLREFIDDVLA